MMDTSRKPVVIVVVVVLAILLLCCLAGALALSLGLFVGPVDVIEKVGESVVGEPAPEPGGDDFIRSIDFGLEVQRMTSAFFPGYTVDFYWNLPGSTDDAASLHVIAVDADTPGYRILFAADRVSGESVPTHEQTQYLDEQNGALWTQGIAATGLRDWAGPDAIAPHDEIAQSFLELHGEEGLLITEYGMESNVAVRLAGIQEIEIDEWDGEATSWEAYWDLDLPNGRWIQRDYTTFTLR